MFCFSVMFELFLVCSEDSVGLDTKYFERRDQSIPIYGLPASFQRGNRNINSFGVLGTCQNCVSVV